MTRARVALAAALVATSLAAGARADDAPAATFQRGVAALAAESWGDAIDAFESLADSGFVHPDASYDRALAYLGRVRAKTDHPGDLGRAAAALEETLAARPGDADAELSLERVRAEVARRRARGGASVELDARPAPLRALVGLAPERTWDALAALASLVLAAGLVLRRARAESAAHLAGVVAVPVGAVALAAFGALAAGAAYLRRTTEDAVVVAAELRLLDEKGSPLAGAIVPEAARVELGERRGSLAHIRWGSVVGWAPPGAVRVVPRP